MAANTENSGNKSSRFAIAKGFILDTFAKTGTDNLPRLSSSFSFFALLSLAPFLVLAVTVSALIFGRGEAAAHLVNQAQAVGGHQASEYLDGVIKSSQHGPTGIIATLLSLVVTFFSASNLFLQLDDAVNAIWNIKQEGTFIRNLIVTRILAFLSVLIFGAVLVGWLVLDSVITYTARHTQGFNGWEFVSFIAAAAFLTLAFSVTFHLLPRKTLAWRDVWPGALVAGFGVALSKLLLSVYFARTSGVYTAAGGVIVMLLWMYYTSMIYLFGIEVTYMYAHRFGSMRTKNEPSSCMDVKKLGLPPS